VEKKKGGLGLMLVKRIMDKVEFIKNEDNNICRLKKKILTS
jgi:serine/threonine-protein kinase RsbW